MARRKRSKTGTILVLSIFVLAVYGGWVIWHRSDVQRTAKKVERVVSGAKKVWAE